MRSERVLAGPVVQKKFKRKAREPKRLFHSPESDRGGVDTGEDSPGHRHVLNSKEDTTTELSQTVSQGDALDMRAALVPSASSKVPLLHGSPFTNVDIPHWPTAISQPLSSKLRVGLRSFPLSSLSSHPDLCLQPLSQASFRPQCEEEVEHNSPSPQESPQRVRPEGSGHYPEVKAIQQTRRLLANARERTRVHTISAAFEALRKQVPCYSYGQKLSKLAILRIACNYILSLAQLAELDYSSEQNNLSFSHCVEQCTRTLQAEGRSKKKKVGRMLENL